MKLRAIIFDFDGTLANTIPACVAGFRRALELGTGRRFSDEEIVREFGATEEGIIRRFAPSRVEECLQAFLQEYERCHAGLVPLPGMAAMLREVKELGARLAIVTGKGAPSATVSLRHFELDHYFEVIETGSPDGDVKPERIGRVLKELQIEPQNAAYVGDAPSDMNGAREAGVLAVAAAWANSADTAMLRASCPDLMFRSVDDFTRWAKRHLQPCR